LKNQFFLAILSPGCHGNRLWAAVHLLSEIERRRKLCFATKIAFSLSVGHQFGSRWGIFGATCRFVPLWTKKKWSEFDSFFIHLFTFFLEDVFICLTLTWGWWMFEQFDGRQLKRRMAPLSIWAFCLDGTLHAPKWQSKTLQFQWATGNGHVMQIRRLK
jgi:hypothetical protein